jgi:uncharacterized damage-inducible protein DinB
MPAGQQLSAEQLKYLKAEGRPGAALEQLLAAFRAQVDRGIEELRTMNTSDLMDSRTVGREHLPSTKLGLLFHAAEHVQRHVGQLLVTVRVIPGMR